MVHIEQTQQMIPLVACESSFCQDIGKLFFGVDVFEMDFGIQIFSDEVSWRDDWTFEWT